MLEYYPIDFSNETFQNEVINTTTEQLQSVNTNNASNNSTTNIKTPTNINKLNEDIFSLYYNANDINTVFGLLNSNNEYIEDLNAITEAIEKYKDELGTNDIVEKTEILYKKIKDDTNLEDAKKNLISFLNKLYCKVKSVKNVIPNSYWYHYINTPQGKKYSKLIKNNLKLSMYWNNGKPEELSNIYLNFNKPKSEFSDDLKELWKIDPFTKYIKKTIINIIVLGIFVLSSFISFIVSSNKVVVSIICIITLFHSIRVINLITGNGKIKDEVFKYYDKSSTDNNIGSFFDTYTDKYVNYKNKEIDIKKKCKKFNKLFNKLNFYDISSIKEEPSSFTDTTTTNATADTSLEPVNKEFRKNNCIGKILRESNYYGDKGNGYNSNCIKHFINGKHNTFIFLISTIVLNIIIIIYVLATSSSKGLLISSITLLLISISLYVLKNKKLKKHLPFKLQTNNITLPFITYCNV